VIAFGLAAELVYTNVLECLDLAGVPVRSEQRRPEHPLVIVGGTARSTLSPWPTSSTRS